MKKLKSQFIANFLAVAQPYWYPANTGGKAFLVLLILLTCFVITAFLLSIAVFSLIGQQYFPKLLNTLTPGLSVFVVQIINSPIINIFRLSSIIPLIGFFYYWKELKYHWRAWSMLAILLFLLLGVSSINIVGSFVGRDLVSAIANKNSPEYFRLLFTYACVLILTTIIVVVSNYLKQKIIINWLQWLGGYFLERYFHNRAYYHINYHPDIDNPDQRLSEEIGSFIQTSANLFLTIFNQLIDLIAFCGILWSISKLLVAALIIYALFGNFVTTFLSQRLIHLNYNQLECEANLRYSLVHVRNNAESIAFYGGEKQEESQVKRRFLSTIKNTNHMIGWQRNIEFFTIGYNYLILIIPYMIVAPLYLQGKIELGVITQATIACNQVLGALSIIVNQFGSISSFVAVTNRLGSFEKALEVPNTTLLSNTDDKSIIKNNSIHTINSAKKNNLVLENITLEIPNSDRILIKNLSISIANGNSLLIMGNSGCGKSSLLRALAGLWNNGTGTITRPNLENIMFLPQRPYMILGTLREQLIYPKCNHIFTDKQLYEVLDKVHLADLPSKVGGLDIELNWDDILSLGEQQRLSFARLLLMRPDYAILDEATSALDLKNEEHLYQELQQRKTTFISVGHRKSLMKYHRQILELLGDTTWRISCSTMPKV